MCRTDFDETWYVHDSWWGTGRCIDCGNQGRVLVEALGTENDYADNDPNVERLLLNDGVPELRASYDEIYDRDLHDGGEFYADPDDVLDHFRFIVEDTQMVCEHCIEARRWLQEWCRSWLYGDYRGDIIEHWSESDLSRHLPFGRLVVLAQRRWHASRLTVGRFTDHQPLVPVETIRGLVDESLVWLRAQTGRQFSDAA